jgi:hypothetical protein
MRNPCEKSFQRDISCSNYKHANAFFFSNLVKFTMINPLFIVIQELSNKTVRTD